MLSDIYSHPHLPLWLHFLLRAGSFNVLAVSLIPFFYGYFYFVIRHRPSCCGAEPARGLELLLILTLWGICVLSERLWVKKRVLQTKLTQVAPQPYKTWSQIVLPNLTSLFFLLFCLALNSAKITYLALSIGSLTLQMYGWLFPQSSLRFFPFTQEDHRIRLCLFYLGAVPWLGLTCLLSLFFLPKGPSECSSISSVKANMHTMQTMVETYLQKYRIYPINLQVLEQDARSEKNSYWKDFVSPFSCSLEYSHNRANFENVFNTSTGLIFWGSEPVDILGLRIYVDRRGHGTVLYKRLNSQHYQIYGTDRVGKLLKDKGSDFILSNIR